MTISFNPALANDISVVRFQIGDTDSDGYFIEDETITALVTSEGSVGGAVIACIQYIITQVNKVSFSLDWLNVGDPRNNLDYWQRLLKEKRSEYGIHVTTISASIANMNRADSYEDSDNDYDGTP